MLLFGSLLLAAALGYAVHPLVTSFTTALRVISLHGSCKRAEWLTPIFLWGFWVSPLGYRPQLCFHLFVLRLQPLRRSHQNQAKSIELERNE